MTRSLGAASSTSVSRVELIVGAGVDEGQRLVMGHAPVRIGTSPACGLRLNDPSVSRAHCELRPGRQGCRIVDLSSTNGTFVNGLRIHDAELSQSSQISVGQTRIDVHLTPDGADVELSSATRFGELVGHSDAMREVFFLLERVAQSDATVLLTGETGTGKELAARALHQASPRASEPYVVVDCAGLAESVIESELFGHRRGAFTGADANRVGLFEAAAGGTLFLDEVDSLPLSLQPRLLRLLESRELRRVGENTPRSVDVRVIAATGRSLATCVNEGLFREDLWFRLAVVEITLPPLRERGADLGRLARHFWQSFAPDTPFPEDVVPSLFERSWQGNVRELRNAIQRLAVIGKLGRDPAAQQAGDLGWDVLLELPLNDARKRWSDTFEERYAQALLERTQGNVTRAAEQAGVHRRTFQRLLARTGSTNKGDAS